MSANLRLVHITDIHLGHAAAASNGMVLPDRAGALLTAAVAEINALPGVDAVIVTGDLTDGGTAAELADVVARLDRLAVPWYAIPGNHDTAWSPQLDKIDRRAFYRQLGRPDVYGVASEIGGWRVQLNSNACLIGLDSNIVGDWAGTVDAAQLAWLDQTLAVETAPLVVVAVHHPLYPLYDKQTDPTGTGVPWDNFMCRNGAAVEAILDRRSAVRVVLTGHDHLNQVVTRRGRLNVATAGLGSYPLVYRILDVRDVDAGWTAAWETHSPADPDLLTLARQRFYDTDIALAYDPADRNRLVLLAEGRSQDQRGGRQSTASAPDGC